MSRFADFQTEELDAIVGAMAAAGIETDLMAEAKEALSLRKEMDDMSFGDDIGCESGACAI